MYEQTFKNRSQSRAANGFAMLEALIAIMLFSIGILGMVAMQAKATQFSVDAEDRSRAALLANEIVAVMWNQNSATVSAADLATWQARVADVAVAGLPGGIGSVTLDSAGTTAAITIQWVAITKKAAVASSSASSAASSASSSVATNSLYATSVYIP